jgi:hypothetical protein
MLIAAVILPLLASAHAAAPTSNGITVTGHAWAPFISPMGEPFRARTTADDTFLLWFRQADRDGDGVLTPAEMQTDADRFFAKLDLDHNGEIDPEELIQYEWQIAPEIQVGMRRVRAPGETTAKKAERAGDEQVGIAGYAPGGPRRDKDDGPQGAARYALLNIPEPVAAADADFNRGVSLPEFRQAAQARFQLLDTAHAGRISLAQLRAMLPIPGAKVKRGPDDSDTRIGNPLPPDSKAAD